MCAILTGRAAHTIPATARPPRTGFRLPRYVALGILEWREAGGPGSPHTGSLTLPNQQHKIFRSSRRGSEGAPPRGPGKKQVRICVRVMDRVSNWFFWLLPAANPIGGKSCQRVDHGPDSRSRFTRLTCRLPRFTPESRVKMRWPDSYGTVAINPVGADGSPAAAEPCSKAPTAKVDPDGRMTPRMSVVGTQGDIPPVAHAPVTPTPIAIEPAFK